MQAVQLRAYGSPAENLAVVSLPEPPPPAAGQVLIGVEYAPIDFSDLAVARGFFPWRPALPAVIGNEGVGRVLAVGSGVDHVTPGDRVLAPLFGGSWAQRVLAPARDLFRLPPAADPQQLAMLGINPPTAALLLSDFVALRPGDYVVQNAANSGVGRSVIAYAKARELRTINLVRRPELAPELHAAGGDVVLVTTPDADKAIKAEVAAHKPKLALDGLAGPATGLLASTLAPGGTVVVYAAMLRAPLALSALDVVFRQIRVQGFFLGAPEYAPRIRPALEQGAALIASNALRAPIAAVYPLSELAAAIAHAERGGKVLLEFEG